MTVTKQAEPPTIENPSPSHLDLNEAVKVLRQGFCLWVGAGVTIQLAGFGKVPNWEQLAQTLENAGNIATTGQELPDRFSACRQALSPEKFQQLLREEILDKTRKALAATLSETGEIPRNVRQIAHLGSLASPIVNFNVEDFTSRALAQPNGSYAIRPFISSKAAKAGIKISGPDISGDGPVRPVYHPHGAINHSGLCVFAAEDYENLQRTLAYGVAVHSAFQSTLAIVGMSLDDKYLRDQIANFRDHIGQILWFQSDDPTGMLADWASRCGVTVVKDSWDNIWKAFEKLPLAQDAEKAEGRLWDTWTTLAILAIYADAPTRDTVERLLTIGNVKEAERFKYLATLRGENNAPLSLEENGSRSEKLMAATIKIQAARPKQYVDEDYAIQALTRTLNAIQKGAVHITLHEDVTSLAMTYTPKPD